MCAIFGTLPPKEVRKIRRKKTKQNAVLEDEEEDEWEDFSGQRIVFVLGSFSETNFAKRYHSVYPLFSLTE